jgi:hypothetical protein
MRSIYGVRTGLDGYYTYRINSITHRLEEQQTERTKTIDKLKAATKYNSTQQLLEKYGGETPKSSPKAKTQKGPAITPKGPSKVAGRTVTGPPATANIPRNQPPPHPSTPQQSHFTPRLPPSVSSPASGPIPGPPEFAPNAFSSAPQYDTSDPNTDGKWYDRILDLLLGDDETSPKNRVVLICEHCRLVNGQAPPGVKRLQDIGKWRCIGCGGWNGEQDEGAKIVQEMKERVDTQALDQPETSGSDKGDEAAVVAADTVDLVDEEHGDTEKSEDDKPTVKQRRGRSKKGNSLK